MHGDREPPARHRLGRHGAAVGVHHRPDDREPQPGARRVGRALDRAAPERLEELLHPLRGDLRATGADAQLRDRSAQPRPDLHAARRHVVPHRVLDEVPGHAFEEHRVAHRRRRCAVLADPQPPAHGLGPRRGQGGHDHVRQIHRADGGGVDGRGHLAAGQQEQPGDQLVRPPGGLPDHLAHPPELGDVRVGVGEGHVDLGPQHRQRRAQLVAGVGDEAALRVERRLQPVEHGVETGGQVGHLAPGVPQRQPGVERLGRQPARRRGDGVQRAQHPPDQPPRHDARRQHDEREGDQPGAQHLRLHRVPDRGADLLGRHDEPADAHPAARREGGDGVRAHRRRAASPATAAGR